MFGELPSKEEFDVQQRLLCRRSRSLREEDFANFDYVLVFDHEGLFGAQRRQKVAIANAEIAGRKTPTAQVKMLGDVIPSPGRRLSGSYGKLKEADYFVTIGTIENQLELFMKNETGWERSWLPHDAANVGYRSRQILAPNTSAVDRKLKNLGMGFSWLILTVDKPVDGALDRVVSVTSEKSELESNLAEVKAALENC